MNDVFLVIVMITNRLGIRVFTRLSNDIIRIKNTICVFV